MLKFSTAKAKAAFTSVLILLAGIIGAKTLKGIVETKFPQFAQYTNYGVLAAALAGTMATKPIVASVAKGSLLFAGVQLLNQLAPDGASKYLPTIAGLGNIQELPQLPMVSYGPTADMVTLGNANLGDAVSFQAG